MHPPVVGFAAYSGTGKTTLLVKLLPLLRERGLRVGVVKHAHHSFEIDHPGKDSYELRHAGATQMLVGSRFRWALIVETESAPESSLDEYLGRFDCDQLDLVLVEGFKPAHLPKIELHRPVLGQPLICRDDADIIAVATDVPVPLPRDLPRLDLNSPNCIVDFIVERFLRAAEARPISQA